MPPRDPPYRCLWRQCSRHHQATAAAAPSLHPMAPASKCRVPHRSSGSPASPSGGSARRPRSARSSGNHRRDAVRGSFLRKIGIRSDETERHRRADWQANAAMFKIMREHQIGDGRRPPGCEADTITGGPPARNASASNGGGLHRFEEYYAQWTYSLARRIARSDPFRRIPFSLALGSQLVRASVQL